MLTTPHLTRGALTTLALASTLALTACDYLGVESATQMNEKKSAEGKAIGGACRYSSRALEDCYKLNPKAMKAAVFDGWKDMDAYMRENNIAPVKPAPEPPKPDPNKADEDGEAAAKDKAADKH
jgi:hypothetical protein